MRRTRQILISALATMAATASLVSPAVGQDDSSLNAALQDGGTKQAPTGDYGSVNATLQDGGAHASEQGSQAPGFSSLTALLGESQAASGNRSLDSEGTALSSPNAILGSAGQPPQTPPVSIASGEPGGFDWSDAMIGAGTALGLMGLASGVLLVNRRRRDAQVHPAVSA